ncbi:MAG: phosphatase PAP2 family protein [Pirellulales bacterium]|nr:phosphatase PAP2 family protein [Pirellulales bacterium]
MPSQDDAHSVPAVHHQRFLLGLPVALVVAAILVTGCYLWVDRPVAWYVHDHGFAQWDREHGNVLKRITNVPDWAEEAAPAVIVVGVLLMLARPDWHCPRAVGTTAIVFLISDQIKEQLKFVFGRTWPDTWIDNNPSLIQNGAYGFHPFTGGIAYSSSPSGHTTVTVAAMSVLWVAYPKLRVVWVALAVAEGAALVSLNYHFVGDVVGGAFLGAMIGLSAARLARL